MKRPPSSTIFVKSTTWGVYVSVIQLATIRNHLSSIRTKNPSQSTKWEVLDVIRFITIFPVKWSSQQDITTCLRSSKSKTKPTRSILKRNLKAIRLLLHVYLTSKTLILFCREMIQAKSEFGNLISWSASKLSRYRNTLTIFIAQGRN